MLLTKEHSLFRFPWFLPMVLFKKKKSVSGPHPGYQIILSYYVSSIPHGMFFRIYLFLTTLTILKSTGQYFIDSLSCGICLVFSSCLDWDCAFALGKHQSYTVVFLFHYIKTITIYLNHHFWAGPWPLARVVSIRALNSKVSFPNSLPFHTTLFGRKSAQPTVKEWRVMLHLLASRRPS